MKQKEKIRLIEMLVGDWEAGRITDFSAMVVVQLIVRERKTDPRMAHWGREWVKENHPDGIPRG